MVCWWLSIGHGSLGTPATSFKRRASRSFMSDVFSQNWGLRLYLESQRKMHWLRCLQTVASDRCSRVRWHLCKALEEVSKLRVD